MIPLIDCHQHLWDHSNLNLLWTKNDSLMSKNYLLKNYKDEIKDSGIKSSIYMEVDVEEKDKNLEIDLILKYCRNKDDLVKGLIIGGDPSSDKFKEYIDEHKTNPYIKGVRKVLHSTNVKKGFCLSPEFQRGIRKLGEVGLLFCLCVRPNELKDVLELAENCKETTFILDHCGNADPHIINDEKNLGDSKSPFFHRKQEWIDSITALGRQKNVICKISGIAARLRKNSDINILKQTIDFCLDAFDEDNIIFGSDWPVCLYGCSLMEWTCSFRKILSSRNLKFQKKIMYQNAEKIFQIN